MAEENVSLVDRFNDLTNVAIKELSGVGNSRRKKLVDNLIGFVGGAGGTGTSTIVANVAYKLKQRGFSVLVIDLSINYPTQQIFFRVKQQLNKKDLVSFLSGKNAIGESIDYADGIGVLVSNNRYIIDEINCDEKSASNALENALDRMTSLFDVVLLDIPLQIDHAVVNMAMYMCNSLYCVWDEGVTCISNCERIKQNLRSTGIDENKMHAILNKRTDIHYSLNLFEELNIDIVAIAPFETAVIEAGLAGVIFCDKGEAYGKNAAAFQKAIDDIVNVIIKNGGRFKSKSEQDEEQEQASLRKEKAAKAAKAAKEKAAKKDRKAALKEEKAAQKKASRRKQEPEPEPETDEADDGEEYEEQPVKQSRNRRRETEDVEEHAPVKQKQARRQRPAAPEEDEEADEAEEEIPKVQRRGSSRRVPDSGASDDGGDSLSAQTKHGSRRSRHVEIDDYEDDADNY